MQITIPQDVFSWMRSAVIPNMYYDSTYTGQPTTKYDVKFIDNQVAFRLGPPRLRQLRVTPGRSMPIA